MDASDEFYNIQPLAFFFLGNSRATSIPFQHFPCSKILVGFGWLNNILDFFLVCFNFSVEVQHICSYVG